MMGTKIRSFSSLPRDVSLEDLVPTDHLYRRLEVDLDLSFVRELVRPLYAGGGRPSVDPVVFFKLQLVMFFEGIRSERRLMEVAADRLSVRWYLGYDLFETLPDHSSLTKNRERYGLDVFRGFFENVVEMCVEAGLVWGKELYFDATKVDADASLDSIAPRFYVEEHLGRPLRGGAIRCGEWRRGGGVTHRKRRGLASRERRRGRLDLEDGQAAARGKGRLVQAHRRLPVLRDRPGCLANEAPRQQGIAPGLLRPLRCGRRESQGDPERPRNPLRGNRERPDARPALAQRLPLEAQTPPDHRPHRLRHHREHRGDRARRHPRLRDPDRSGQGASLLQQGGVCLRPQTRPLPVSGRRDPHTQDLQNCQKPGYLQERAGYLHLLLDESPMHRQQDGPPGPAHRDERYVDRVKSYRGTFPYEKALRKRRVWVEPLFGEAKDWHGMRRFRLRRLEKVNAEALLVAAGQNLKRLLTFGRKGPRRPA